MSFFNLVHLGPQNSFKAKAKAQNNTDKDEFEQDKNTENLQDQKQPQANTTASPSQPRTSQNSWHDGSHVVYKDLIRKHRRNPNGPTDLYSSPVTTQQDYGWWTKDQGEKSSSNEKSWTHTDKHPLVNSEMTRFVDEMSLTDKEFSLY